MVSFTSTDQWEVFFRTESRKILKLAKDSYVLSEAERDLIAPSLAEFQLGESSEGHHFRECAKDFSERYGIPSYSRLIDSFIAEENRHSVYLGQFMKQHKLPRRKHTFLDGAFRHLRRLLGIETSIRTLVIAEVVALTYYPALANATHSPLIKKICAHMVAEEADHINFQMQHIQFLNLQRWKSLAWLADRVHTAVFICALLGLWWQHKKILSKEHSFGSYIRKAVADFDSALHRGKEQGSMMLEAWRKRQGADCKQAAFPGMAAMSLIEILIVIALIGGLMGFMMKNIFGAAERARIDQTKIGLAQVNESLLAYRVDNDRYPTTDQGLNALISDPGNARNWRGPYGTKSTLRDPWGEELTYESDGHVFKICSSGPDLEAGTADDISYPPAE